MDYTEEQTAIIEHKKGHAMVNAVAGSGKTAVMVARIVNLIKNVTDPKKILVLMFNTEARADFYRRLKLELENSKVPYTKDRTPEVRTISSLALRTISMLQDAEVVPQYEIVFDDTRVLNRLCREALKASDIDITSFNVDYLKEIISWVKSRHDDTVNYQGKTDCKEVLMFLNFEKLRHKEKLRFFDDWVYDTVSIVKESPDLLYDVLSNRYQHIVLDEFQDINQCQMKIIDIYTTARTTLLAVGDPQQAIYGFRGSDPMIMVKDFPEKYKPKMFNLSKTFRFGQNLSDASNRLISHNELRFDVLCRSAECTPDTKIHYLNDETYNPAELIKRLCPDGDYSKVALLGREKWHWIKTEIELLKHGIPYFITGKNAPSLLDQPTVKSLLGYLRLADEATNFKTLSNSDRRSVMSSMIGIPSLSIALPCKKKLIERLKDNPDSYNIFPDTADDLSLLQLENETFKKQKYGLERRELVFDMCLGLNGERGNATRALKAINNAKRLNYKRYFESTAVRVKDAEYRIMIIDGLLSLAEHLQAKHPTINGFLNHIDQLHTEYQKLTKENRQNCVSITTMHQSKGLQFDHVILPELHADTMPAKNENDEVDDIEGDRRLFYVAMTRARKNVYLVEGEQASPFIAESLALESSTAEIIEPEGAINE